MDDEFYFSSLTALFFFCSSSASALIKEISVCFGSLIFRLSGCGICSFFFLTSVSLMTASADPAALRACYATSIGSDSSTASAFYSRFLFDDPYDLGFKPGEGAGFSCLLPDFSLFSPGVESPTMSTIEKVETLCFGRLGTKIFFFLASASVILFVNPPRPVLT